MRSAWTNRLRLTIIAILSNMIVAAWSLQAEPLTEAAHAPNVQSSRDLRVSILGASRGVAFLATADPVAGSGRAVGSHPVEWLQVKVLVEPLANGFPTGTFKWDLVTPDGQPFATKLELKPGVRTVSEASSTIQIDATQDVRLREALYPIELPADVPAGSQVWILGVSGRMNPAKLGKFEFSFLKEGSEQPDSFRFTIPIP